MAASFLLSLVGWLVGTGEVYLILVLLGHPVSWLDGLLLESLGQAIRGAAFAVPGLGRAGGRLSAAGAAGGPARRMPRWPCRWPSARGRLLLGLPGLLYLHLWERGAARYGRACNAYC